MSEGAYLDDAEIRRLVPIVMDLIRDDLNPVVELRRGVLAEVLENENPGAVLAVQLMVGRWFARSLAEAENEKATLTARIVELETGDEYTFKPDEVHTAHTILVELEAAILEQRSESVETQPE